MKYFISAVLVSALLHVSYSDKCIAENFDIIWRTVGTENGLHGKILDVHTNEPRIINVAPNQQLSDVCQNTFKSLKSLYVLVLNTSGITRIEPGSFENNRKLYHLDLSNNKLETIQSGIFGSTNLRILLLHHNHIIQIDSTAFDNMARLEIIDLSYNEIQNINSEWFKNTNKITHLILAYNGIKALNANVFQNLKHITTLPKLALLNIDLEHNKIKTIDPKAFNGLVELKNLHLNNNDIESLDENTFSTLNHLGAIHLEFNKFECISGKFDFLGKFSRIYLSNNPWNCTCIKELKKWSNNHGETIAFTPEHVKCLLLSIISYD